jgi:hypothetical protein
LADALRKVKPGIKITVRALGEGVEDAVEY